MLRALTWTVALIVLAPGLAMAQPKGEAEKLRKQAAALHADGDHDAAADKLREALVHSNHAQIYFDLCLVLEAAGELNQARGACRAVRHGDEADEALLANAQKALDRVNRKLSGDTSPPPDPTPPDPPPPDPNPVPDPNPPDPPPPGGNGGTNGGGGTITQPPPAFQPPPASPTSFGVKIGFNVASISFDGSGDSGIESKTDLAIGGFMVYQLTPVIGLGVEGMLMGKGAALDSDLFGESLSIDLIYLEAPVTARFAFAAGEQLKIHVFGGLAPAILVSATDAGGDDFYDDTTPVDIGLVLGGGVTYKLGSGALVADLRSTIGLVSVDNSDNPVDTFNRAFSLLAGYQF